MTATIDTTLDGVRKLYEASLAEHGASSSAAVGWPDESKQQLRFDKLLTVLPDQGDVSVVDWGCGTGALVDAIDARGDVNLTRYDGYDLSRHMLAAAGDQHWTDRRVRLHEGATVGVEADYSIVSGTFNVRLDASESDWREHIQASLGHLWQHSRRGLAFNLLTSHVDWRENHLYYGDPGEWLSFAQRELSRHCVLLHDYPLWEWTLVVRRSA